MPRPDEVLDIRRVAIDHPHAVRLITALDGYYRDVYGGGDATPLAPGEFDAPAGWFAVGYVGDEPVACGGWRARDGGDDPALRVGDAELKRLYVAPEQRGHGFGAAMLAHLEATAAAAGRRRIVLETGVRQPAAIGLYGRRGYVAMAPFGVYRGAPGSRCFAKSLLVQPFSGWRASG